MNFSAVAGGGVVPLSAGWLAERCPEVWATPAAANNWLGEFKNYQSRDIDHSPDNDSSKTVEYRIEGERGKWRKAVTIHPRADTAARLARMLGKAITLKPLGNIEALSGGPFVPWPDFAIRGHTQIEGYLESATDPDDRDAFTAPIIAGLIADGWHPVNAKARADADWLWRHGPPVIAGGLMVKRATAFSMTVSGVDGADSA